MTPSTDTLFVSETDTLVRLDKFLTLRFPSYSRTYFQYLIENGFVLINGQIVKKREIPHLGDEIEVCFQLTPELSLEPEAIPLDILYEDADMLAINKPAGMVVHPAPGNPNHTFVNALLYHCKELPYSDSLRPGIVHRLDKETTGLLLAAKTTLAHQKLVEAFSQRKISKKYLAICFGNPGNVDIQAPLKRHPVRRQEMHVDPTGKEALSRVRVLERKGELSLIEVELITGRTHQIRAHLKHIQTPILGDPVYGSAHINKKFNLKRQLLHAYTMQLLHPVQHTPLFLKAPPPEDFALFWHSVDSLA